MKHTLRKLFLINVLFFDLVIARFCVAEAQILKREILLPINYHLTITTGATAALAAYAYTGGRDGGGAVVRAVIRAAW